MVSGENKSLISAHVKGDRDAFEQIVRRFGPAVLGYLRKMTGNIEQAEDLFQETFKRVHEKGHTFRGGNFKSWVFSIATRASIDAFRRNKRFATVPLATADCVDGNCPAEVGTVLADKSAGPQQEASKAEAIKQVRTAIGQLPVKQRAALVLSYYQQLSYKEVAEAMGCSVGTIKTQVFRALRTLANKLPDLAGEI